MEWRIHTIHIKNALAQGISGISERYCYSKENNKKHQHLGEIIRS